MEINEKTKNNIQFIAVKIFRIYEFLAVPIIILGLLLLMKYKPVIEFFDLNNLLESIKQSFYSQAVPLISAVVIYFFDKKQFKYMAIIISVCMILEFIISYCWGYIVWEEIKLII